MTTTDPTTTDPTTTDPTTTDPTTTDPTTTATAWDLLARALRQRRPVQIGYHGRSRLVCPHALGWTNNGRPLLLAYQTGGHTSTGTLDPNPHKRWRCLLIDEIDHLSPAPTATWATAHNYDASHPFPANTTHSLAITNNPNTAG